MKRYMNVGRLVKTKAGTQQLGKLGIVVDLGPRWSIDGDDSDELLVTVLYPCGEELKWSECNLEILG